MAYYYDISTAPWAFVREVDMGDDELAVQQCTEAVHGLRYPLIVKHFNGYGSIGMGKDCRCEDVEQVVKQVRSKRDRNICLHVLFYFWLILHVYK